ncbi:MAG TPA: hypothetical protein V6C97_36080 [Oculatellaceae cyanobacterium]
MADEKIFPESCDKPFWVTEWRVPSKAGLLETTVNAHEQLKKHTYFHRLHKEDRLGGIFWYVRNESDDADFIAMEQSWKPDAMLSKESEGTNLGRFRPTMLPVSSGATDKLYGVL